MASLRVAKRPSRQYRSNCSSNSASKETEKRTRSDTGVLLQGIAKGVWRMILAVSLHQRRGFRKLFDAASNEPPGGLCESTGKQIDRGGQEGPYSDQ